MYQCFEIVPKQTGGVRARPKTNERNGAKKGKKQIHFVFTKKMTTSQKSPAKMSATSLKKDPRKVNNKFILCSQKMTTSPKSPANMSATCLKKIKPRSVFPPQNDEVAKIAN